MLLTCIVGSFIILFAAAERQCEMKQAVTIQDNKKDVCNPSKDVIKCCICLKMIRKYIPMINALINQKIQIICSANFIFRRACRVVITKVKDKVIKGFFPGGPLESCRKYKLCR